MRHFAALPLFLATFVTAASAQDIIVRSNGAPIAAEYTAQGPAFPGPGVFRFAMPTVALPVTPFPLGDMTIDNSNGRIWYTNGFLMANTNDPAYPPLAPIIPVFPTPPAVTPVTGIALNTAAGIMFCTNGVLTEGVLPIAGTPVVFPLFPFGFPIVAPPMTGLDWDPITLSLWGCDAAGNVYNFLPGGAPLGPQPVIGPPATLPPLGPASDIAISRWGSAPAGIHVQFPGFVLNYSTFTFTPTPAIAPVAAPGGIAYHNLPDIMPGQCACPGSFGLTTVATSGPATEGNAAFALTLSGVPPGTFCLFAGDIAWIPGGVPFGGGCTLYMILSSGSLFTFPTSANGLGVATFPIALPFGSAGFIGWGQWGISCPGLSTGFVLSDGQQLEIGTN